MSSKKFSECFQSAEGHDWKKVKSITFGIGNDIYEADVYQCTKCKKTDVLVQEDWE